MKTLALYGGMWLISTLFLTVIFLQGTPESFYRGHEEFCGITSFVLAVILSTALCACLWGMS
jgi:uncharacterized membrane protein YkgB